MHRFTIVPIDRVHSSLDVIAIDAGTLLPVVEGLEVGTVDILRDSTYVFSVEPSGVGFWSIFLRSERGVHTDSGA